MAALRKPGLLLGVTLGLVMTSLLSTRADTATFELLHSFNLADGNAPVGNLVLSADGNFYGVTHAGGQYGKGAVIQISPTGTVTVLHSFAGKKDGASPQGGLIQGDDGTFYGTTEIGGASTLDSDGNGTVYRITAAGVETVLYAFKGNPDGATPRAGLIQGADGNFYGTTFAGGANDYGTVFQITPAGKETVLYSFLGKPKADKAVDGARPVAGLIQAADGNFYGTTSAGGASGKGILFQITSSGKLTIVHSFDGTDDGASPRAGLVEGLDGNLYGTTYQGGTSNLGTVFQVTPAGVETILHSFTPGSIAEGTTDGANPQAGLTLGTDGKLYGATTAGGKNGNGTIFQITPAGVETILYAFGKSPDGIGPNGTLTAAVDGCLYGTTASGGANGNGTVFCLDIGLPAVPADLNADLQTEILFQNKTTGQLAMWDMDKYLPYEANEGEFLKPTPPAGWNAVTTTYLNNQLNTTLLLHNPSTGQMMFWYMNGTTAVNGALVYPIQNKSWRPVAMADFNGDSHPDILFQNPTTGQLAVWYMNGNYMAGGAYIYPTQKQAWKAIGVADFNGDGHPDILFQNPTTGQLILWYMNGNYATTGVYVTPDPNPAWHAVMVVDCNRDGTPDILFQNPTTGQLVVWYMQGSKAVDGDYIVPTQDPIWTVIGSR